MRQETRNKEGGWVGAGLGCGGERWGDGVGLRGNVAVGCGYCWELAAVAVGSFLGLSNLCVWAMYLARALKGSDFVRRK